MKLLKILLTIPFISLIIARLYYPYIYSFSILPHKEAVFNLILLFIPLLYILLPLEKFFQPKSRIIFTKIIASFIYFICLFSCFGDVVFKQVIIALILTLLIAYLYCPSSFCFKFLDIVARIILCLFIIGTSVFTLYIPFRIAKNRYIETHQPYTEYVDIIPTIKYAITTQNGYDEKIAEHMPEKIFKQLNQKKYYPKLDHFGTLELTELYQKQDKNDSRIIYVDTRSTMILEDANNNHISGGQDYQQFIVLIENNTWYLIGYDEPVSSDWRYK